MKNITNELDTVTGGNALGGTATVATGTRRGSSSSTLQTQLAMQNVTSALDSLKNNNNNSWQQVLPLAMMAKWMNNR
jgi:hypothetical protein